MPTMTSLAETIAKNETIPEEIPRGESSGCRAERHRLQLATTFRAFPLAPTQLCSACYFWHRLIQALDNGWLMRQDNEQRAERQSSTLRKTVECDSVCVQCRVRVDVC